MSHKKNVTKEDIEREYLSVSNNLDQAAEALSVSKKTLSMYMKKLGIKAKNHTWNVSSRDLSTLARKEYIKPAIIKEEYLEKRVNMFIAAKTIGCSVAFLRRSMKEQGIGAKERCWNEERTRKIPILNDKKWLRKQLKTKSQGQITDELGTSQGNVAYYVSKHSLALPDEDLSRSIREGLKKKYPDGRFGKNASNWQGGERKTGSGYLSIYSPDHPNCNAEGYVMEHRLAMEKKIGRLLKKEELVHHKNGNKSDNRIENLELISSKGKHTRDHFKRSHRTELAELETARLTKLLIDNGIDPSIDKAKTKI